MPIFTFITGKNKKNPIFFQNRFDFLEKSGILNDIITSGHSSVVEHHVANVMVVGSSPIARSIFFALIPDNQPHYLPFNHKISRNGSCCLPSGKRSGISFFQSGPQVSSVFCPFYKLQKRRKNIIWD